MNLKPTTHNDIWVFVVGMTQHFSCVLSNILQFKNSSSKVSDMSRDSCSYDKVMTEIQSVWVLY